MLNKSFTISSRDFNFNSGSSSEQQSEVIEDKTPKSRLSNKLSQSKIFKIKKKRVKVKE